MNTSDTKEIQKTQNNIVMPAVSSQEAVDAWKKYEEMKRAIATKEDIQLIQGNQFLKKSYWRKVATFFNLTTEVVSERNEHVGKTMVWHFTVKAIAPNGRSAIGAGSCDAYEKATLRDGKYMIYNKKSKSWYPATPNSLHNIRSTAETRATNRSISNLVGGGEVSAEEINQQGSYHYIDEGEIVEESTTNNGMSDKECSNPKCTVGGNLPATVLKYSMDTYGKPLCYQCQQKES